MYTGTSITYLQNTEQLQSLAGRYLDPETHQYLDYVPSSQSYRDGQGVFFQYVNQRYVRTSETTQDAFSIDRLSRNGGGIWTIGSVFVDNVFQQRTPPSRSGEQQHDQTPTAPRTSATMTIMRRRIRRSRSDAEVDTLPTWTGSWSN